MYKCLITLIVIFGFSTNHALAYEITFYAKQVRNVEGNLELSFRYFKGDKLILQDEAAVILDNTDMHNSELYYVNYRIPDLATNEDFDHLYFYGVQVSSVGTRNIIGFLPLSLITNPAPAGGNRFRKPEHKPYIIYPVDTPLTGVRTESCWDNPTEETQGRGARESYPLTAGLDLMESYPVTTLLAIKDLVEHKFINTCPTWNRIRGILRDRLDSTWRTLDHDQIEKGLDYLKTVYSFANDADYKEIPKIYNDLLLKLFKARGGGERIKGKNIREYIYDEQTNILREHFFKIIWRSTKTFDTYQREGEFEKCLSMFNALSTTAKGNQALKETMGRSETLRKTTYRIMRNANNCAASWAQSTIVEDIRTFLNRTNNGNEFIQRFIGFYEHVDTLDGRLFPENLELATDPYLAEEVRKYYKEYKQWDSLED